MKGLIHLKKGESMIALYIIGGILLLFVGIGFLRATVTLEYKDEFALSVKVLFFNINILPKKKKKPLDYSKFSAKKLRKEIKKAEKKKLKAEKKKAAKKAKKAAKKEAKAAKKAVDKKLKRRDPEAFLKHQAKEKAKKRSLNEILTLIKEVLDVVTKRFRKHFRIKITRIRINVATGDAAKTAVLYGVISQSVAYILEILDRTHKIKYADPEDYDVGVDADFLSEKTTADIKIAFSLRVHNVFDIVFRAAFRALKNLV